MKLKEMWKRFWTLDVHNHEGFTLVELIIVIAILAILSTGAIAGYSAYVQKAKKAVDQQLLAEINQAFRFACIDNMCDSYDINAAEWDMETMTVASVEGNSNHPIVATFTTYFDGANAKFELIEEIVFHNQSGMFIEGSYIIYNGFKIAVSKELADAMKNNNFSALGAAVLTEKVDKVSDIAALLIGLTDDEGNLKGTFANLVLGMDENGDMPFLNNLRVTLGMDPDEFEAFILNDDETLKTDILANSLVLSAAQKTQGMDTSFLGTPGSARELRTQLDSTDPEVNSEAMAKLALTYGMYTSYVKNNPDMTDRSDELLAQNTFTGMTGILEDIESEDFQKYLASDKGQADLNAYMASMQIINDSANQSSEATMDILSNGFTDPNLVAALAGLMGSSNVNE